MPSANREQIANILGYMAQHNPDPHLSPEFLDQAVGRIMAALAAADGETPPPAAAGRRLGPQDYPLGQKRKDLIQSSGGLGLDAITLEKVVAGELKFDDIKIKPETLEYQAQIAESVNRPRLADNLRRARELTRLPDQRVLEIYNMLRPYRCTKAELLALAEELEGQYQAKTCAALVREAAEAYEKNGRIKQ